MDFTARGPRTTINVTPGNQDRQPTLEDLSKGAFDITPPEFKPQSRYLQRTYKTPEGRRALEQLSDELMAQREFSETTPLLERMGNVSTYLNPRTLLTNLGRQAIVGAATGYALLSGDLLEGARQYVIATNAVTVPLAFGLSAVVRRLTVRLADASYAPESPAFNELRAMADPVLGKQVLARRTIDVKLKKLDHPIVDTIGHASIGASLAVVGGAIANLFGADIDYSVVAAAGSAFSLFALAKEIYQGTRYHAKLERYATQERTARQD